jgi:hypothetical protein
MQTLSMQSSFSATGTAPHRSNIQFQRLSESCFGIFDIVANKSFGVVTRKMTGFYPATSKKHLEGTFNLYIYVALII